MHQIIQLYTYPHGDKKYSMKTITIIAAFLFISLSCFSQQAQKYDTSTYVLVGKLNDFRLLFATITTPDDVTPNQKKMVLDWMSKGLQVIKSDTTKPKEKPKTTK